MVFLRKGCLGGLCTIPLKSVGSVTDAFFARKLDSCGCLFMFDRSEQMQLSRLGVRN